MTARIRTLLPSRLLVAVVVIGLIVAAAAIARGLEGLRTEAELISSQSVTSPGDGMVVATEGGLDGGRLWFLWDGGRQRIQQPRPISEQDLTTLDLRLGEPINGPMTVAADDRTTTFAIYPADGLTAALHLLVGDTLYPVTVLVADELSIFDRRELESMVVDRALPPA